MNRLSLLLLALIALCASCGRHDRMQLDVAQHLLDSIPDSALTILRDMDRHKMTRANRARHGLLLTIALDKNDVDISSDSVIAPSLDYYLEHPSDKRNNMLAHHYSSLVLFNQGNFTQALAPALESERIALEHNDLESAAKTENLISLIFNYSSNFQSAIEYEQASLKHSKAIQRNDWIAMSYDHLAACYLSLLEPEQALQYVDSAIAFGADAKEPRLAETSMMAYSRLRNDSAVLLHYTYLTESSTEIRPQIKSIAANSMNRLGKTREAKLLFQEAMATAQTEQDSIDISWFAPNIIGQHSTFNRQYVNKKRDKLLLELTNESIYEAQIAYTEQLAKQSKETAQTYRYKYVFIIITSILLTIAATLIIYIMYSRAKHRHIEQENKIWNLLNAYNLAKAQNKEQLSSNRSLHQEIKQLRDETEEQNLKINTLRLKTQKLFIEQFAWVEALVNQYIDYENSTDKIKAASKLINGKLDEMRKPKFFRLLENAINENYNNILNIITKELPNIPDLTYKVLVFTCAGFSSRVIAILLQLPVETIYTLKSRLLRKLKQTDSLTSHSLLDIIRS